MPDLVDVFENMTLEDELCAASLQELIGDEPPDHVFNVDFNMAEKFDFVYM